MYSPRSPKASARARLRLAPERADLAGSTQVRVHVQIPVHFRQEPVIAQLTANYGMVVNITGALLGDNTGGYGCFDLELRGTVAQISQGLAYLQSLNLKIVGKPNPAGDSWYC